MKTSVDFRADNEGNIVEITTTTYTPEEWMSKAGDVYRFAQTMSSRKVLGTEKTNYLEYVTE
jgi:hypothetical protein